MHNHRHEQSSQLNQALATERALRQARRRQQPAGWPALTQAWATVRQWVAERLTPPTRPALHRYYRS